jgi:hypothetical protein
MRHLTDTERLSRVSCACQRNIDTDGELIKMRCGISPPPAGRQFSDPNIDTTYQAATTRCFRLGQTGRSNAADRASAIASLRLNCWRLISEEALSVRGDQ